MSTETIDDPAAVIADVERLRAEQQAAQASEQAQAQAEFKELIRKLAAGESITATAVDSVLRACGRSPAELKAAVDAICRRRQLKLAVDEVPALLEEQEALSIKLADAGERYRSKLAKLQSEHAAAADPVTGRLSEIRLALQQADEWKDELRRTYRGPARQALAAVREKQRLLNSEAGSIRESLVNLRGAIRATAANLERERNYPADPTLPAIEKQAAAKIRECEAEIVRLENRQAEIAQALAGLETEAAEAQSHFVDL